MASSSHNPDRRIVFALAVMVLQVVGAVFFLIDGFEDQAAVPASASGSVGLTELVIALALLAGVVISTVFIVRLHRDLQWQKRNLDRAKGALMDHVSVRFRDWKLTPGEGDVALFALKGCDVAEIARLRGAALGTVRSQLSQIYAKAGVSSQAMLVALFIEDLLDAAPAADQG
ncbi:DNA-binding CsgD family transcriptional regulator [Novosphingobium kunmingense]|uniref:DNA-binding CsgD family transcriptional regulator n=1 Tax=Novosphingobium kunmingense TaxID=1211806 RepID=A0A2N0HJH0_9SPHN|nr:response regulator transcription factor [Novosphingobium kunmingense]PKB19015.1 DNA-binding CsgD family transcriptional regulator [Novosphingobium kunmingense]